MWTGKLPPQQKQIPPYRGKQAILNLSIGTYGSTSVPYHIGQLILTMVQCLWVADVCGGGPNPQTVPNITKAGNKFRI